MAEEPMNDAPRYRYRIVEPGLIEGRLFTSEPGDDWGADLRDLIDTDEAPVMEGPDQDGSVLLRYTAPETAVEEMPADPEDAPRRKPGRPRKAA